MVEVREPVPLAVDRCAPSVEGLRPRAGPNPFLRCASVSEELGARQLRSTKPIHEHSFELSTWIGPRLELEEAVDRSSVLYSGNAQCAKQIVEEC